MSSPLLSPTRVEPLPLPSFNTQAAPALQPVTPAALPDLQRTPAPAAIAATPAPPTPVAQAAATAPTTSPAPAGPPATPAALASTSTPPGSSAAAGAASTSPGPRSLAASGAPDAGARLGQDVATPASLPASAARLNLELVRPRGGAISAQGGSGLLQMLPHPPEAKSKLAEDIEKAAKADCRKAYSGMGLLAVVPLAVDAVRDKGCRW